MRIADRMFGWLLVVASLLHAYGSIVSYARVPVTLVWALAGAFAGLPRCKLSSGRPVQRPSSRVAQSCGLRRLGRCGTRVRQSDRQYL